MGQDSPPNPENKPRWYVPVVAIDHAPVCIVAPMGREIDRFGKTNQTDSILHLSKEIAIPVRQHFSVHINFFPFNQLNPNRWLMVRIPGIRERIQQPLFSNQLDLTSQYVNLRSADFRSTRVSLPATIGNFQLGEWGNCCLCGKPTRCICKNYPWHRHMICHREWLLDNRTPWPQCSRESRRDSFIASGTQAPNGY